MQPFCGVGYITSDGKPWELSNALLRQSLASLGTNDLSEFGAAADHFIDTLPRDGQVVDLAPVLDNFFLENGIRFLLGSKLSDLSSRSRSDVPDAHTFLDALHSAQFWANMRVFFGPVARLVSSFVWHSYYLAVHRFIDHYVRIVIKTEQSDPSIIVDHGEGDEKHSTRIRSLVSSLAQYTRDHVEIRWQVIQGLMAMQDTTSTLVSNTLFLLARHPAIWAELRTELQAQEVKIWTASALQQVTLLQNILHESLRLHPIFGQSGRTALRHTVLPAGGGSTGNDPLYIPAGSIMMNNFYALHRQVFVFGDDAETFRPARWNHIQPGPCEYMPFGHGQRHCVGQNKSLSEAGYLIARMAMRWERLEPRDDRPWVGDWKLIVRNANGCRVGLYETESAQAF
ncbi:MAG: hypothetical protein Q9160_006024 [Pyrenula sp. 1 TL-2023]